MLTDKKSIRATIQQQRLALSATEQVEHASAAAAIYCRHVQLVKRKRVALYLANKGELSTAPLIGKLHALGKELFLPVLHPHKSGELVFQPFTPGMEMTRNKYGIIEPAYDARLAVRPQWLELVLMPLVAFDGNGSRVGMGGGYYDRTLAGLKLHKQGHTLLIGFAHALQETDAIQAEPWDIKLHGVITEQNYTIF